MAYAIGIDSGTQGTKALVTDFSGRVLGRGYAVHETMAGPAAGASEQEPRTWIQAMEEAMAQALQASAVDPAGVVCLGVSGQQHGFVPLDGDGRPIRPAKLWNDTSTTGETAELLEALGGREACIAKLGINLAVGFTASKILWLKKNEPDNFRRLRTVLLPHNYLNYCLTGKYHMEYGDASGTGLMDIRSRKWNREAMAAVDAGLETLLPDISHPAEAVGYLRPELARKFGLKKVLVAGGGGDNMMAAIGSGNVREGCVTLSLGSSGTIYSYSTRPVSDPQGEIAAFCDSSGGWLPLLCTMNVTNVTELFKRLLSLSNEDLNRAIASVPPGAGGLIFLPFVDGERVPALPEASAVFFGLTRRSFDVDHLARAVVEGTVFNLGYGLGRMRQLGVQPRQIRATGGGSRSRPWLQIAADIFQASVVTLVEEEAAALGAALQAIWSYLRQRGEPTEIADITDACVATSGELIEPQNAHAALYQEMQERFNRLWQALAGEFSAQRRLQEKFP